MTFSIRQPFKQSPVQGKHISIISDGRRYRGYLFRFQYKQIFYSNKNAYDSLESKAFSSLLLYSH